LWLLVSALRLSGHVISSQQLGIESNFKFFKCCYSSLDLASIRISN
jgi:hypothetical protein